MNDKETDGVHTDSSSNRMTQLAFPLCRTVCISKHVCTAWRRPWSGAPASATPLC